MIRRDSYHFVALVNSLHRLTGVSATILVSFLLFSLLTSAVLLDVSSANPMSMGEPAPPGIRIKGDGSVEGTDRIRRDGNVYTLMSDLDTTIVVLCDNATVDGAGYAVYGKGASSGIFVQQRSGVTIKNVKVVGFQFGIKFTWAYPFSEITGNSITDNVVMNNTYGIWVDDVSRGTVISRNRIMGNTYGAKTYSSVSSSSHVFRNNQFNNNVYSIVDEGSVVNDIDSSNLVNGKPVYCWVDRHSETVPSDAGYVALYYCSNITVQNLTLKGNGHGILLLYTTDSVIEGNTVSGNVQGITIRACSNNTISRNRVSGNAEDGITVDNDSHGNVVYGNIVESNGKDGVYVHGAPGTTVSNNKIANNGRNGIFACAEDSRFTANNITLNLECGILFGYDSNGNKASDNWLAKNGMGILITYATGNTITGNTMIENVGWAMRLNGSQQNNVIHHNNFIDNNAAVGFQVSIPGTWSFRDTSPSLTNQANIPSPSPNETLTFGPGNPNTWDDGKEGNYWSDYTPRYPNATEVGRTGVGDTPFFINENNIDRFPLLQPAATSGMDLEPVTEPSSSEPTISKPANSPTPIQQNPSHVETGLPLEFVLVITTAVASVGVVTVSTIFLQRHKKLKTRTTRKPS